ncbi:MAG: alpha/beta fold hydrolase [Acidimicrobiales bacterium]
MIPTRIPSGRHDGDPAGAFGRRRCILVGMTEPLAVERWGRGRRLALAHGFTQNARCWGLLIPDLATDHEVIGVDLPGHGRTAPVHDDVDLDTAAHLLVDTTGPAVLVGYSMGGRIALHAAVNHPESVDALVVVGATGGIDSPEERAARPRADDDQAERLERVGLAAFLEQWLANPLFAGLGPDAAAVDARLTNRPEGLAATLRHRGTGQQRPLWPELGRVAVPTLVIAGAGDAKFVALGERLVASLPQASLAVLPGTHAVHLESPTATADRIRSFVEGLDGA